MCEIRSWLSGLGLLAHRCVVYLSAIHSWQQKWRERNSLLSDKEGIREKSSKKKRGYQVRRRTQTTQRIVRDDVGEDGDKSERLEVAAVDAADIAA